MVNNKNKKNVKERLREKLANKNMQTINTDDLNELEKNNEKEVSTPLQLPKFQNIGKKKIFVCSPCYCGNVHVKFMKSVMNLQLYCLQYNIGFEFYTIPFDSLIPRARNACVTRFMQSNDSTHLLFIDADIEFDPRSVHKMLSEEKDVIAGIYSKKALNFKAIHDNFEKVKNETELIQSAGRYNFNFKNEHKHEIVNGVVEVLDAPTGFLLIQKNVFETMIEKYPEKEYVNDVAPYNVTTEDRFFDFFPSQIFQDNGKNRYLSEDYGFCRLWQNIGGKIYADLTVQLNHIGQFNYCGNPLTYLTTNPNVSIAKKK